MENLEKKDVILWQKKGTSTNSERSGGLSRRDLMRLGLTGTALEITGLGGGPVRPALAAQVSACDYEFPEFFESIARIFPGGPILIGNNDFPENSVFRVDRFRSGIPTINPLT